MTMLKRKGKKDEKKDTKWLKENQKKKNSVSPWSKPYNQDHKCQCCQKPEPEIWWPSNKQHSHVPDQRALKTDTGWYTWVRHVFELRASSDYQENQVEAVERRYNQEKYLHALENTQLD